MNFLWSWWGGKSKFQLAKWEKICLPKVFGGWGIKSLQWFNHALYLKSLWCGLFGPSLWTEVFISKYLKKYSMEYWIRKDDKSISQASNIWYGFTRTFPWLGSYISWNIGNGEKVILGIDSFVGGDTFYNIPGSFGLIFIYLGTN